ncbi:MAG: metal-sensing transcriptional repressor [Ilumatobacteraceae bacterium]
MAKTSSARGSTTVARKKPSYDVAVSASRTRLRRASGQLTAVIRMLDEGKSCDQVITQLAAVNKAVNAAAFTIIAANLEECLTSRSRDSKYSAEQLQKLFLTLN